MPCQSYHGTAATDPDVLRQELRPHAPVHSTAGVQNPWAFGIGFSSRRPFTKFQLFWRVFHLLVALHSCVILLCLPPNTTCAISRIFSFGLPKSSRGDDVTSINYLRRRLE